jgi:tetratricopeptide (TPR) repeat protein
LKHDSKRPNRGKSAQSAALPKAQSGQRKPRLALSPSRKLLFVVVGFVALPLLLLGGVELGLRVAGYGFPTGFFRHLKIGSEEYLVDNDQFGRRFFPAEMARSPAPVVLRANKPPGTYRVFILGESAALGDPKPAYGAGRYLQALLKERFPDVNFEVVNVGVTAINSHAILSIARECAQHQGDLWIVYMGNNEMVGPFGAMTVFGKRAPSLAFVRLSLAIQETRVGQLLMSVIRKLTGKQSGAWEGMKMFLQNRVPANDRRRAVVYENFSRNLRDILQVGLDSGARVILSTVAVNLKDCAPFGSQQDPQQRARESSKFKLLTEGTLSGVKGNIAEALEEFSLAARTAPAAAEPQFQLGTCFLRLTNSTEALQHFQSACDLDALPFRADSHINSEIGRASKESGKPALALCDAAGWFATNSPDGVPGKESFYEHVHFNFDGNYRLARLWAEQLEVQLPAALRNRASEGWASQATCERRLGLTDWNRYKVLEDVQQRLTQAPFTDQLNHSEQVESLKAQVSELQQRFDKSAATEARELCLDALKRAPEDHRLHESYAEFLEGTGDLKEAISQWEQVSRLIPHHHVAYFQAGRLHARLGDLKTARANLAQAVTLRPNLAEGWLELGNVDASLGDREQALRDYEREQQLAPKDHRAYYRVGKVLSAQNHQSDAIKAFRSSLLLKPTYWEARYALGEELAFSGEIEAARKEFEEVIRQKPDYAMAHLNLGVALTQQGHLEEALREFEETTRLDPNNQLAPKYATQLRAKAGLP